MTAPRYAKLAARMLGRDREVAVARFDARVLMSVPAGRGAAVDAIERALREKGRKRARVRWMTGIAAAAAAIAVAGGGVLFTREGSMLSVSRNARVSSATDGLTRGAPEVDPGSAEERPAAVTAVGKTGGDVTVTAPGSSAAVADGKPLAPGSRVVARAGGRALLAFSTGTELAVEEGSDMTIVEEGATQIFALAGGALRADVAKLGAGQRFLVRTADTEVEVRGTSFRVAVAPSDPACGGGTTTRVAVYEGTVVVRNAGIDWTVAKGDSWPAGCVPARHAPPASRASRASRARGGFARAGAGAVTREAASASSSTVTIGTTGTTGAATGAAPSSVAATVAAPVAAAPAAPATSSPGSAPSSTLAEQNDRFAAALAAKRSGDASGAIAAFERFVAAYPASPLAESALVERMKLLASTDRARGAAAARQYLVRYPGGFARADAEAIAAEGR
jgi:hypothetical protein